MSQSQLGQGLAGGGGGGSTSPAGSTGQIQFNDSGSFGANSNLAWDDSNDRLGVGTGSPSTKLHLAATEPTIRLEDTNDSLDFDIRVDGNGFNIREASDSDAYRFVINGSTGDVGIGGATDLSSSGANAKLAVSGGFINVDDDYGLVFGGGTGRPAIQGSKADGEIYITNAKLGIGTSSPSRPLTVSTSDSAAQAALEIHNTSSGDSTIWLRETSSEWALGLDNSDSNNFKISNSSELGSNDRFILTTAGNLCLGGITPAAKLHVEGGQILSKNASGDASMKVWAGGTSDPHLQFTVDGATDYVIGLDNDDSDALKFCRSSAVGTSTQMTIASDGAITGGGLKLYGGVFGHGSSDASSITLVGGNSSSTSGANITIGGTSGSATREVIFKSNAIETMRISADGAIGLAGANYGTSGQVLTSGGSSAAPTWTTLSDNDTTYTAGTGLSLSSTEFSADIGTSSTQVAAGDHNHDSSYAALSHNHDSDYSAIGHNHDSDYQALDADTAKTDVVQTFTAGQRGEVTGLTDGANIAVNLNDSNNFSVTLGGNRTLDNPSNCTAGQSGVITITQDGTGSRTLAYGAYWKFTGGTAPTLTTTASAVDVLAYYVESATRITATLITDTK